MQSLKQRYGERLCVYTVWVGNEDEKYGQPVLNQFSNIAGCGYGTTADRISSPDDMANFVKSIFLTAGPPPAPKPVVVMPEPTPPPPAPEHITLSADAFFDFNKAELRPRGQNLLSDIASRLQSAEYETITVVGHSDRLGSHAYNQKLSEKRAQVVADFLVEHGVHAHTINVIGKGETEPVTTKDQCKNLKRKQLTECLQPDRRVDVDVTAVIQE
jgi:OOP family OmpA-OmpF porin